MTTKRILSFPTPCSSIRKPASSRYLPSGWCCTDTALGTNNGTAPLGVFCAGGFDEQPAAKSASARAEQQDQVFTGTLDYIAANSSSPWRRHWTHLAAGEIQSAAHGDELAVSCSGTESPTVDYDGQNFGIQIRIRRSIHMQADRHTLRVYIKRERDVGVPVRVRGLRKFGLCDDGTRGAGGRMENYSRQMPGIS